MFSETERIKKVKKKGEKGWIMLKRAVSKLKRFRILFKRPSVSSQKVKKKMTRGEG